ncbi:MAG: cysteine hydrolase [Bacteroidales bacterium]|nr:cysteine hydrolase [Bacteroidales bacterium]
MKKFFCLFMITLLVVPVFAQESEGDQPEKTPMKPALILIDVQNQFMPMMAEKDVKDAPQYINWYMMLFRHFKLPVIRVYHSDPDYGPEPGSEGFAFDTVFKIEESDPMVIKTYGNAFTKTNLDSLLQARGINTLFLCGLSATGCVLATYIGANDHDYEVFMLKNALLSHDADLTKAVQEFTSTISWDAIKLLLENTQ